MMELDIGSGRNPVKGCLHLDVKRLWHVEIIADINYGLPFKDSVFDAVYLFDVIEHVEKPIDLMEESYRVLKPNGTMTLRTSHYLNPLCRKDITHKHYFSKGTFDIFDPRTKYGKDYGFYTKARFKILVRRLVGRFPCFDVFVKLQKVIEWV